MKLESKSDLKKLGSEHDKQIKASSSGAMFG